PRQPAGAGGRVAQSAGGVDRPCDHRRCAGAWHGASGAAVSRGLRRSGGGGTVTDTAAETSPYRRLTSGERKQSDGGLADSVAAMRRLLPLGMGRFEARLARAMEE